MSRESITKPKRGRPKGSGEYDEQLPTVRVTHEQRAKLDAQPGETEADKLRGVLDALPIKTH